MGKKTTRTDTCVFWDQSTLHWPARPAATVITSSQSKLWGNLGRKREKLFEFLISRSASEVGVKIEAVLQGSTIEERVQTTLWALGLLHNETLCAFETYFSWEPAKLSSRGVTMRDFLHNCIVIWNRSTEGVGRQQYTFLLLKVWVMAEATQTASYQGLYGPPHVKECPQPCMKWRHHGQLLTMQKEWRWSLFKCSDWNNLAAMGMNHIIAHTVRVQSSSFQLLIQYCCILLNVLLYFALDTEICTVRITDVQLVHMNWLK